MAAAPFATRMTTNSLNADRERLAREARDIAEAAARFAKDVDRDIATADHTRLAEDVQRFLIRAIRYAATKGTAGLFTTELADAREEK